LRLVVQRSHVPPPPSGPPPGVRIPRGVPPAVRISGGPTNYLAEFTVGPYLYWAVLQAEPSARAQFEQGVKLYYAHAKQAT
jgi:hypothetical protein